MGNSWIKQHNEYWIGFLFIAFIGSILSALQSRTFSFVIDLILGVFFQLILSISIGTTLALIMWVFGKRLGTKVILTNSIIVCFVLSLIYVVDFFL